MAFDIGAINLNFYSGFVNIEKEPTESNERDWQEPGYPDDNAVFDTPVLPQPNLLIRPPHSCEETPASLAGESLGFTPNFLTDAPELEHYLRQTNPLQGQGLKRKCQSSNEQQATANTKKVKTDTHCKSDREELMPPMKTIKWSEYKRDKCCQVFTSSPVELNDPSLVVTCDKGLTFSPAENVFICQKKNHFQISMNLEITHSQPFVKVKDDCQSVICYKVHLYAVKAESRDKKITMEQSTADRTKRPYTPVRFPGGPCGTKTLTIGRLHFSETTSNNMRKKGKLNPDQRYFQLVVDVRAYTKQGNYSICCQISENVIVRASNPGQFENDVALWSKDKSAECVYRMGHVGINTDKPDQCLSVNGNIKLTGQIMTPSDIRLTEHLHQTDTRENLEKVSNMKLYKYRYNKQYAYHAGLSSEQPTEDLGVLGSELKTLIPDAVTESDRLLMESLGAIQELSKTTQILTSRMIELETKTEILELVLKNIVSQSMNMSIPN